MCPQRRAAAKSQAEVCNLEVQRPGSPLDLVSIGFLHLLLKELMLTQSILCSELKRDMQMGSSGRSWLPFKVYFFEIYFIKHFIFTHLISYYSHSDFATEAFKTNLSIDSKPIWTTSFSLDFLISTTPF